VKAVWRVVFDGDDAAPVIQTVYNVFKLKSRGSTVRRIFAQVGAPPQVYERLAQKNDEVRAGGPPAASGPEAVQQQRFHAVARLVRDGRMAWDAADPGTAGYRNPELAVPRAQLSTAYEAATYGALSREDVAYCLYSAIKHNERYAGWVALCPASVDASEAVLDLIMVPSAGTMIRPVHRAAWALQGFDEELRDVAAEVAETMSGGHAQGSLELVRAAQQGQVEATVADRLDRGYYPPGEADKVRSVLQEWRQAKPVVGARGQIARMMTSRDANRGV
jgi:hypothetical protein